VPLLIAAVLPSVVVFMATIHRRSPVVRIGVVGAIALNLAPVRSTNQLNLPLAERVLMGATCLILMAVELTIARTKPDALFFLIMRAGAGLSLRGYAQRRAGFANPDR